MPSFANIEILGHVGREPESRYTQAGQMMCSFSVAVNPPGKRQPDGSYIDSETDWYRVTCFGKTAERVMEITKGSVVHVRGNFKTDRWTAQDGGARTNLDILADRVTNVSPRQQAAVSEDTHAPTSPAPSVDRGGRSDDIDNLPF